MSVWISVKDGMPPLGEDVLILYKLKDDDLKLDNLFYGVAHRYIFKFINSETEAWATFTEYQGSYEVVYWAKLYDMPHLEEGEE